MSNLVSSMQAERFKMVMRNCATSNNLQFNIISAEFADITLSRKNGQSQQIFFTSYDSTIEFMATTQYEFSSIRRLGPGLAGQKQRAERIKMGTIWLDIVPATV